MLEVNNVALGYGSTVVLNDISIALSKGEIGCLLGPSGCGKTSLLRAICGFNAVLEGQIFIDDKLVAQAALNTSVRQRNVGMVFQDYALFPHMNVQENIAFGLFAAKKNTIQARVEECAELVGMQAYLKKMPHQLSGGQKQRVALARALAPKPQILLMDEPFSSLDVALKDALAQEMRHILKDEKITGLLVTHDQKEAFTVADKIGVIYQGKIHQWGDADALYNYPKTDFVARFIGEGRLVKQGADTSNICALVRPEHVNIHRTGEWLGTVISRKFLGSHFSYNICVEDLYGIDQNIIGLGPLTTPFDTGNKVKLDIDFDQTAIVSCSDSH